VAAQFEEDDGVTPVIFDIASRYSFKIEWWKGPERPPTHPRTLEGMKDFVWGPQGDAGISLRGGYLWAYDADVEIVFHELVHLILGKPGLDLCEGYLLMPFEWELAKWAARRMKKDGHWFLRQVRDYQEVTKIQEEWPVPTPGPPWGGTAVLDPDDRRTKWWRNGIVRAQKLGLLDDKRRPTFRLPDWKNSGVKKAKSWSVKTDARWS
jgi:hypothetical protein